MTHFKQRLLLTISLISVMLVVYAMFFLHQEIDLKGFYRQKIGPLQDDPFSVNAHPGLEDSPLAYQDLFTDRASDRSLTYESEKGTRSMNYSNYLRLSHTRFNLQDFKKASSEVKETLQNMIRRGTGLEPYVTERGEKGWIENGIVYRPWRRPDPSTMHRTHPSPYFTEYEAYMPFNETQFFEGGPPAPNYKTEKKIILWHTPTRYTVPMAGLGEGTLKHCPDFPCQITTNRKYFGNSSAAIFTAQIIKGGPPARTSPDQVFILHNHEPPFQNNYWATDLLRPEWKSVINWTMTYRMDSDFIVPYGIVRLRPTPVVKDYQAIVAKKTKTAAWLVSNCHTRADRTKYVRELQKYAQVDIFGKCGTFKCPHEEDSKCADIITYTYKFYLGFESSYCPDYLSEKLFHYLTMDTIIVARGSDEYFQHVPSEIFINTADFATPKQLAERMQYLADNDDAYIAMLKEKDKYMSLVEGYPVRNQDGYIRFMAYRFESVSVCHICQRIWNLDKHRKSVPDILQWFRETKKCYLPKDLGF